MAQQKSVVELPTSDNGHVQPEQPASRLPPDPPVSEFDPKSLAMSQDFAANCGVKAKRNTVKVMKPSKEWFNRVNPDPDYRLQTGVIELKEDSETYLVAPSLWADLATERTFSPRLLLTAMNKQRVVFIWPISLPGPDGKWNDWHKSAMAAAIDAETQWVRVVSDRSLGAYQTFVALGVTEEPNWTKEIEEPFSKLLEIAFKDKFIREYDHPVLRKLRGEI